MLKSTDSTVAIFSDTRDEWVRHLMPTNKIVSITHRTLEPEPQRAEGRARAKQAAIKESNIDQEAAIVAGENTAGANATFWIGADGSAGVFGGARRQPATVNIRTFSSLDELETVATEWRLRFFVTVWNKLPGQRPVTRFENRRRALDRLWREIQKLPTQLPLSRSVRPGGKPDPKSARVATSKCSEPSQSKGDQLIALLKAPGGARLTALMEATGWQAHTVRGFLSRRVSGQLGLHLQSVRRDGERVYSLPQADQLTNQQTAEEE